MPTAPLPVSAPATASPPGSGPGLLRVVGRWEIVGLALNDVIGSGVYLLPAAAAAFLGPLSLAAVGVAGLAVLLLVLCFAEASSRFDGPGSAYLYARTAFGPLVGFEVGWMTWLARVSSVASLSVAFAVSLSYLVPSANQGVGRALAIALPMLALTAINVVGVKSGVRASVFLVIVKVLPLLVFLGAGVWFVSWARVAGQAATAPGSGAGGLAHNLGPAALLLLFAYAGFENTPAAAGEFLDPKRDVPFALIAEITFVTLLYLAVQWVALGTLPSLATSATPLADAAQAFLGSWGGWLLTVGAMLSILGTNSNTILAGPRYLFALAEDGFGPPALGRALARVHPRYRTPAVAILVQTAIALPLALSGTFVGLAALSVVARLATYLGTAAAVPVLRRKMPASDTTVRLPGGPAIPLAACALSVALAASAGAENLLAAGAALVVGAVLFAVGRRGRSAAGR